jgi:hypothetical protein
MAVAVVIYVAGGGERGFAQLNAILLLGLWSWWRGAFWSRSVVLGGVGLVRGTYASDWH